MDFIPDPKETNFKLIIFNELIPDKHIHYFILNAEDSWDRKPVPYVQAPELDRLEGIFKTLVLGTRDYVYKNGFKKAVIGLIGGIDSALTAAITGDALGIDRRLPITSHYQKG